VVVSDLKPALLQQMLRDCDCNTSR